MSRSVHIRDRSDRADRRRHLEDGAPLDVRLQYAFALVAALVLFALGFVMLHMTWVMGLLSAGQP